MGNFSQSSGLKTQNDALVVHQHDATGNSQFIFPFGETLIADKFDDVSVQFQYNQLNTQFDIRPPVLTGDGVVNSTNAYLSASSASSGSAKVSSRDSIRYRPGHSGFADFTAAFIGTGVGEAGCFDDDNGFILKYDNGNVSFGYRKGGTDYLDDQSVFNGDISVSDIDFSKLNIFRISFGYLGVANPTLWIKKDVWYILHQYKTEGLLTGTHVNSPVFPMRIDAENGIEVRSGSWNGGTLGQGSSVGKRGFTFPNTVIAAGTGPDQGSMTLVGTNVNTIVLFRSKSTFNGVSNNVKARLSSYEFVVEVPSGNVVGTVVMQIIGNPTLSGAATYSDINANSSIMEYDHTPGTGASVTYASGGSVLLTTSLNYIGTAKGGAVAKTSIDAESIGAFAYAGDQFAIIAKDLAGNGVNVRVALNWEELF